MSSNRSLRGKSIVITGASSGIGRAAARRFASYDTLLTLASRRKDLLDQAVSECEALGGRALAVEADVTNPEAVNRIRDAALDRFGAIDIWINNAGTGASARFRTPRSNSNAKPWRSTS